MATFTLRRFSCPETLKAIAPARLLAFLKPHRAFFLTRGVKLPQTASDRELDYEELAKVFEATATTKRPLQIFRDFHAARAWLDEVAPAPSHPSN